MEEITDIHAFSVGSAIITVFLCILGVLFVSWKKDIIARIESIQR